MQSTNFQPIRIGARGAAVVELQTALNSIWGASLVADGIFGQRTGQALAAAKSRAMLPNTPEVSTAIEWAVIRHPLAGQIDYYPLAAGQFFNESTTKRGVVLHHTVGGKDPRRVVDVWGGDSRGRIGTHFVVGASGQIVQCMALANWAHHLGLEHAANTQLNQALIGIEICSLGALDAISGQYVDAYGRTVPANEVVDLSYKYRGKQYVHEYTPQACEATIRLCEYLKQVFGFDYSKADMSTFFEFNLSAFLRNRPQLTTHSALRADKSDLNPQPRALEMVKKIINL